MAPTRPKNLIQLHVSQLKLGMFVSALDRSWLETPFVVQGIAINSISDIDRLSEYANYVWIDPLKHSPLHMSSLQQADHSTPPAHKLHSNLNQQRAPTPAKPKHTYNKSLSAADEHQAATLAYNQGKSGIQDIIRDISSGRGINMDAAQDIVNQCAQSVLRNPDALMWMSKIREQDEYTAEHCLNVAILSMIFARHLGLPETDIIQMGLCGLLHDLGKVKIAPTLLNKTTSLSAAERDEIERHPRYGYELLQQSSAAIPAIVAEVALSHHERIDGLGYPNRISALKLPDMVRMISLVDAYDAMTADRCYCPGRSNTEALKIIYEQKGKQFDADLAHEFIRCIGIYPPGAIVELMNGCVGVVMEVNEKYRHLPRVLILRDADGHIDNPYYLNLTDIEFGDLSSDHLVKATLKNGALGIDVTAHKNKFTP